jgi:hypothetical protein
MSFLSEYLQAQHERYQRTPETDEESVAEKQTWALFMVEVRGKVAAMHPAEKEAYFRAMVEWDSSLPWHRVRKGRSYEFEFESARH